MKNALNKIAALADHFETKLAQPVVTAPDMTPRQIQDKLTAANLEASLDKIKKDLMEFYAIQDPAQIKLDCKYLPESKQIACQASFARAINQQVIQRTLENKKVHPSFHLGNYIKSLLERNNKNIPTNVMLLPPF